MHVKILTISFIVYGYLIVTGSYNFLSISHYCYKFFVSYHYSYDVACIDFLWRAIYDHGEFANVSFEVTKIAFKVARVVICDSFEDMVEIGLQKWIEIVTLSFKFEIRVCKNFD